MLNYVGMSVRDVGRVSPAVRAEPVETFFISVFVVSQQAGGSPAATHFLLLRQKKVSKEKASRSPGPFGLPCAARVVGEIRKLVRCAAFGHANF
jgi:hypothetical protein